MNSTLLLSIIVPNFNYGRFLPEFFACVCRESLPWEDVEIIFVDDGSSDGSADMAEAIGKTLPCASFTVLRQERLASPARIRNIGFARAKGRYAVSLDPDDFIAQGWLSRLMAVLEKHPEYDFAYGDCLECVGETQRLVESPAFAPEILKTQNPFVSGALMRSSVWRRTQGFRDNTAYEDWDFWVQAVAAGAVGVKVPGPLYMYRMHGGNYSVSARKQDGKAKAAVVLNNPRFFHPKVRAWARANMDGEAWAVDFKRGLIPRPQDVETLWKIAADVERGMRPMEAGR